MLDPARESELPPAPPGIAPALAESGLDRAIRRGIERLLADQAEAGYWCYALEADCTIPAEYICYLHFQDERDPPLERRLAAYLLRHQLEDGGWPLFFGGKLDVSCSVKAYFALKLAGEDPDSEPMRRAREAILAAGGAARCNVFTRFLLAMFEQIPWRAVPYMPVEITLLPRWFFFNLDRISYWSRTVLVPLTILFSLGARAVNPLGINIRELFPRDPAVETGWFGRPGGLKRLFLLLDRCGRAIDPLIPGAMRRRALDRAEQWLTARLNGVDGLGAIFPAMVNASIALKLLGYAPDHPWRQQAGEALQRLVVDGANEAWVQPCVSPVWDTALAALALLECGQDEEPQATRRPRLDERAKRDTDVGAAIRRALDWLAEQQVLDAPGDWRRNRPDLAGGGWAFQFRNDAYPDLDDTAVVAWAMQAHDPARYRDTIERACAWLAGMQSGGGFASFDVDNTHEYLNQIPFADHGALLDPPTADVTARCLTLFAMLDDPGLVPVRERALAWLLDAQETDGSWFGRWGTNFIYGTWSALMALARYPADRDLPAVRRAVAWLESRQRDDGGWGEGNDSYFFPQRAGRADASRAFQTAWAVLALVASGEAGSAAAKRGADFLVRTQAADGAWPEPWFTAPGFPRVFYLKYHGYSRYFPLWALAAWQRSRSACRRNAVARACANEAPA